MEVTGVTLHDRTPSVIPSWQLYRWTKYSIGRRREGKYRYGAAKPPDPDYGWFPVAIGPEYILIAATETHLTPEEAIEWLRASG